jgi:hypothetical protein
MARGDHIFVYGVGYSHHGIDCGDGRVIHFDSNPWRKLASTVGWPRRCRIGEVSHDVFSSGRVIHVRPYRQCDDPDTVLRRARSRLGEESYDLLDNNCEHFAVWCKTGRPESSQASAVEQARDQLGRAATTVIIAFRIARRLPPSLRPWACGAALAFAGATTASRYWKCRRDSATRGES